MPQELKEIRAHCYELYEFLTYLKHGNIFAGSDWYRMAAGVKDVDLDFLEFDYSIGWCGEGDRFSFAEQASNRSFVTELTRFAFVWSGVEATIEELRLPRPESGPNGKIQRARSVLDSHFTSRNLIQPYTELINEFERIVRRSTFSKDMPPAPPQWTAGAGLQMIYKARNQFAHGDLEFSVPHADNSPCHHNSICVSKATRLALISIQMLLLATQDGQTQLITPSSLDMEDQPLTLEYWLNVLHYSNN